MVAEAGLDPDEIREEYHAIIKLTLKEGSIDEQAFFPVGDAARAWAKKFLSGKKLGEKLAHPEAVINAGVEARAIVKDPEDTERIWNVPSGARFSLALDDAATVPRRSALLGADATRVAVSVSARTARCMRRGL